MNNLRNMSGYVDPFASATVRAERVDQGVDYAGTGTVGALGPGKIVSIVDPAHSGWMGGYWIEELLTAGPLKGTPIFTAEGITPYVDKKGRTIQVGDIVTAGQPIATLIPGAAHGIETGIASGSGTAAYASQQGGGYSEGQRTAAGQFFSNILASVGAAPGLAEGRPITGTYNGKTTFPTITGNAAAPSSNPIAAAAGAVTGAAGAVASTVGGVVSSLNPADLVSKLWNDVTGSAAYAGLFVVLLLAGAILIIRGLRGSRASA